MKNKSSVVVSILNIILRYSTVKVTYNKRCWMAILSPYVKYSYHVDDDFRAFRQDSKFHSISYLVRYKI